MKRKLLFFILSLFFLTAFSQGDENVLPVSWNLRLAKEPDIIKLLPLQLDKIRKEDSINDLDKSMPWRYGVTRSISLDLAKDGLWTVLPDGSKIWQVAIQSPQAVNLGLNFNGFYLPAGARLQLYNNDHTDVSKNYTYKENRENKKLGSWYIEGDIIWVEYFQPAYVRATPIIKIDGLIHGYRMGLLNDIVDGSRGMNDSGDCNYDVNCPIGSDFDSKKDILKKAVALLNLGNGYLCTASLVNNTRNDKSPLLLTANHCLTNSDPSLWSLRFNWVSPNPVCGTGEDSGDIETNFTMSGATLLANNSLSDFALVKLVNNISESWDVVFAGWDNSDTDPSFEVGIHHPNGDIMKICRDDSGAEKTDANGTQVWLIGGGSHGTGNGWEIGTTESGSSGSPLFNENGKIIGQLYAGQSACNGTETNHDYDIYGRFGVSWASGATSNSRLKEWLDPDGTGQTSIETLQNILNVQDFEITGELKIYPNPASSTITVMNSRYPHLRYVFSNMLGQVFDSGSLSNSMNTISVQSLAEGIYFLSLTEEDSKDSITKKIVVAR